MADLCSGLSSRARSGVTDLVLYTAENLAGLMARRGAWWAAAAIPLLGVLQVSTATFCSAPPPDDEELTQDEYFSLLSLSPWDTLQSALAKLANKARILIWTELCECVLSPTTGFPVNPPASVVQIPGGTSVPSADSNTCGAFTIRTPAVANPGLTNGQEILRQVLPAWTYATVTPTTGDSYNQAITIDANWKSIHLSGELTNVVSPPAPTVPIYIHLLFFNSSGNWNTDQISLPLTVNNPRGGMDAPYEFTHGSSYRSMALWVHAGSGVTPFASVDLTITLQCNNDPYGAACRTDPALMAISQQIYQLLQLVQRQQVPFAYLHGEVNTVSGTGEIGVQGILGMLVEITDVPTTVGEELANPNVLWQAGWINWGNADGWLEREFLTSESHVSMPAYAGQFTRFAYTLPPGVSATMTQLVREATG